MSRLQNRVQITLPDFHGYFANKQVSKQYGQKGYASFSTIGLKLWNAEQIYIFFFLKHNISLICCTAPV